MNPQSRLSMLLRGDRMVLLDIVDTRDPKMEVQHATIGPLREGKAKRFAEHLATCRGHFDNHWIISIGVGRLAKPGERGMPWMAPK